MEQNTLAKMRIFAPPFIVLVYWWLVGVLTGLWEGGLPVWGEVPQSTISLVIAVLYYATPARKWSNSLYFPKVTDNIRDGMVRIAGRASSDKRYEWKDIRSAFYVILDNDQSLTRKVHQAYFNGFIWTTVADARALAVAAAAFTVIWHQFDQSISYWATLVFLGIALLTFFISSAVTKRHITIGNEQLEIIEYYYADKVKEHFDRLDD